MFPQESIVKQQMNRATATVRQTEIQHAHTELELHAQNFTQAKLKHRGTDTSQFSVFTFKI